VFAGSTVNFSAAASGTAPWPTNGSLTARISRATNTSLTLANVVETNNGSYTIVASSPYGSATSTRPF